VSTVDDELPDIQSLADFLNARIEPVDTGQPCDPFESAQHAMSEPHAGSGCSTMTIFGPGFISEDATLKPGCSDKTAHSAQAHSAATPTALSPSMLDALVKIRGMRQTDYTLGRGALLFGCRDD